MSGLDEAGQGPIVAELRFDIPVYNATTVATDSSGTLDLDEVGSEVPSAEEVISLREGESFRVGRAESNDLVLMNSSVSRYHSIFSTSRSGLVLSDLSSLNGTFVNGRRISTPINLSSDDEVRIGHVKIAVDLKMGMAGEDSISNITTQSKDLTPVLVTVLVTDVRGYTKMAQQLPPTELASMLDRWLETVSSVVRDYGGEVDKYIGDCVMALWRGTEDDATAKAVQATEAANEILSKTKELVGNSNWPYLGQGYPWDCCVALNTGDALMGTVGGKDARDFTVLGDTVNLAFRLAGLANSMDTALVFGQTTSQRISHAFPVQSLGSVVIEGRSENVELFTLKE